MIKLDVPIEWQGVQMILHCLCQAGHGGGACIHVPPLCDSCLSRSLLVPKSQTIGLVPGGYGWVYCMELVTAGISSSFLGLVRRDTMGIC